MNHSPKRVIHQLLIDLNLGDDPEDTTPVWPIYYSVLPDGPNNAICVYDTENRMEGREMVTGESQEHYGIQIAIRAENEDVGTSKGRAITESLDTEVFRELVTVQGAVYLVQSVGRTTGVLNLGREAPQTDRRRFSINALASITLLSDTGTAT